MPEKENKSPLLELYGDNAFDLALEEINKLKRNSNIPFDTEYVTLGISFIALKASEIFEEKKSRCSLTSLVSESFGEAAICTYN
ncbi:hypothetical protein JOC34_000630 [Virgibacillus halotolerans]|uniref:hypothetical protein n=1 Tax=Virgibacillus halotolerans TaxID=1071053 RepID=UPI0019615D3B|nr:hypothetical protein [Virgibacillus halotolerans]MBM7598273.1 hypothetical protein [Virgibacillus halotolerans]